MGCLSYCRKGPASPQFAQSAQWYWQRYCIDLIYPILLLAIQPFALLSVGLLDLSSRWCFAAAPHGLPLFIGGPPRSNFAAAVLPAVYSRWCFATAVLPAASSRWCSCRHLRHGGPASCLFTMALCRSAAGQLLPPAARTSSSASAPRPATNLIWRRRSPVWLAIWRTWAGFANSQHRDAAFVTPDNICAHSSLLPH